MAVAAVEDAEDKGTVDEEKTNENKNRYYDFVENFRDRLLRSLAFCSLGIAVAGGAPSAKTDAACGHRSQTKKNSTHRNRRPTPLFRSRRISMSPPQRKFWGPTARISLLQRIPSRTRIGRPSLQPRQRKRPRLRSDKKNPNHAILLVGNDDFPLPIPIVKQKGKWFFDTKVGREEILNRRIGANELNAIQICRGFVEAQHEYALEKHDGSKVNQYAQRIISSPGKHDGLAWQNADGTWGGPVGEEVAKALEARLLGAE